MWFLLNLCIGLCLGLPPADHVNWPRDMDMECGISFADRIIGGVNASLGQYPWLARLSYMSKKSCVFEVVMCLCG